MTEAPIPILDLSPETDALWDELNAAFQRVLRSGQFVMGPEVEAFEAEAAEYLGVRHAVGVNSGTDALVIALRALGVGSGDEVITTPFSFFATAESIESVGARPVFVDIEEGSFNIDPEAVAEAVGPKTRALLPVHLYGRPANLERLGALAREHRLVLVEDCAQAFGASSRAGTAGTVGDAGAFSFFPSKNLGGLGDGGLVVTDDEETARLARMLRAHGAERKYHNELVGYNSRLDSLQAALLRVKLPRVDKANAGRRRVAALYDRLLADVPSLVRPEIVEGHVFHQYTVRVLGGRREVVRERLDATGVQTMVYYPVPQDQLPLYAGRYAPCPTSDRLSGEVLSLPIWPSMPEATAVRVATALREALHRPRSAST